MPFTRSLGPPLLTRFHDNCRRLTDRTAYTFLDDDGTAQEITFGQLELRVAQLVEVLQSQMALGERAVLMYPSGIDFIVAFLACLRSGIVAVPVSSTRTNKRTDRLLSIFADCGAKFILTTRSVQDSLSPRFLRDSGQPCVIATDSQTPAVVSAMPAIACDAKTAAMLQYTSGSTSAPKGVTLTHGNIAVNLQQIVEAFRYSSESRVVSWLPLFHDMGLFGGILPGLWEGFSTVFMSPASFLRKPFHWLKAVSDFRGTATGGPNFAFDLCVKQISEAEKATLDLSCLETLWNGAEPIQAPTIDRFTKSFQNCGFRPSSMYPCYGLAESTLKVSGGWLSFAGRVTLDGETLDQGEVVLASEATRKKREIVSCGPPMIGTRVEIVNPRSRQPVDSNRVGEIWVQSEAVASGYWNQPDATQEAFHNYLPNGEGPFLATGDLGFLRNGDLFVCGRRKDIIIVHGRNVHPHDIELIVARVVNSSGANDCGAFGYATEQGEQIGVVIEASRDFVRMARRDGGHASDTSANIKRLADEIHRRVLEECEVAIANIVFVRPSSFPRTSSGKVQRRLCRRLFLEDELDVVARCDMAEPAEEASTVRSRLQEIVAGFLTHSPQRQAATIPADASLQRLGLDSLAVQSLIATIESGANVRLHSQQFDGHTTLDDLASAIASQANSWVGRSSTANGAKRSHEEHRSRQSAPKSPVLIDSRETSLSDLRQVASPDLFAKTERFQAWSADFRERGFQRFLLPVKQYRGGRALVGSHVGGEQDREVKVFCSADYLDLSQHPGVIQAGQAALDQYGASVSSVPLIAGLTDKHYQLERELAEFLGTESCVLFPTGLAANTATIAALCSETDYIVVDSQVHYSILEGVKLAGSTWRTFAHSNPQSLRQTLQQIRRIAPNRGILVILEGVYGIDGDIPPLTEVMAVAHEYSARVLLDDAHALGVLGDRGRGTAEFLGCSPPDMVMGSLSKSLGSFGGFIAARQEVTEYLRYFAKAIVFAVGLPTVNVAAATAALHIIRTEPQRIRQLERNARGLRDRLASLGLDHPKHSRSSIMSCLIGNEGTLKDVVRELFQEGVWAEGLPFPAVSRGQERLRFRARSSHTDSDLDETAAAIERVFARHGLLRAKTTSSFPQTATLEDDGPTMSLEFADEIVAFMAKAATAHGWALPWLNPAYARKSILRDAYWPDSSQEFRWFTSRNAAGEMTACVQASKDQIQQSGMLQPTGLIGNAFWLPGCEHDLRDLLRRAVDWLPSEMPIVAPAQFPVQVFGAGAAVLVAPTDKPLFESTASPTLLRILQEAGFRANGLHEYQKIRISPRETVGPSDTPSGLTLRQLQRDILAAEVERILPVFNETIGGLERCSPMPSALFQGLVSDLRDLIVPGLCWLAEVDGEVVGFSFAFPNVVEAFLRAQGLADIADFEDVRMAMERTRTGFLAWLGVRSAHRNCGVGLALVDATMAEMRARHYDDVWVSWEIVEEGLRRESVVERIGTPLGSIEYVVCGR